MAGWWYGSLALLADGWHMSTHVAALSITAGAYWMARRYARDERFAFGTFKIEVLGGFASAIILGMVALLMVAESLERLFAPNRDSIRPSAGGGGHRPAGQFDERLAARRRTCR